MTLELRRSGSSVSKFKLTESLRVVADTGEAPRVCSTVAGAGGEKEDQYFAGIKISLVA